MSQSETGKYVSRADSALPASVLGNTSASINAPIINQHGHHPVDQSFITGIELPPAERVRALARHAQSDSVAYQSVAVAGLQILERVLTHEKAAAAASLSLAQRDKLATMVGSLEQTVAALRMSLSAQGSKMLFACSQSRPSPAAGERSWWFALTEAIEALESGIDAISGIVSCQPKGGAARVLSGIIARLLHRHHNELLGEAEQWIG